MDNKNTPDWLGNLKGAVAEAQKLAAQDKDRRLKAEKKQDSIILTEEELRTGEWDSSKILKTKLGLGSGESAREITPTDLARFKKEVERLQNSFKKGIKAEQVIDLSRKIDKERAKNEIKNAVVLNALNGEMRFITNSGGSTPNVSRHHVLVQFNKSLFDSLASGGNTTPREAALKIRKGYLSFDCDCGRHVYWGYKYMATVGGYNCGKRVEKGYPKIRNPELRGVACKHVIRVMSEILSSGYVLSSLTEMMKRAKSHAFNKSQVRNSQAEAEKAIAEQDKRKVDKIDAQADKARTKRAKQRLARRQAQEQQKLTNTTKKDKPPKKSKPMSDAEFKRTLANMRNLGFSQKEIDKAIAKRNAQKGN